MIGARVWPAQDYTRITFESKHALKYNLFSLEHPRRLVLDLEDVDMGPALAELQGKIVAGDPYIERLRVGRNRPGVVRVVVDLKAPVKPQIFSVKPVADYRYRLVLDMYPLHAPDPLAALIQSESKRGAGGLDGSRGAPVKLERVATIVVDPGHGGEDTGARGADGTLEKNVTLMIARRLQALINDQPDMRAVLTRTGDYYVPLAARVAMARRLNADLFVSIHANSCERCDAQGSMVFALSERRATSTLARLLARSENSADLVGGVDIDTKDRYLARTLLDLSQTATIDHSLRLGHDVLAQLGQVNPLHSDRVEQASFAVLTAPDVPSILVETAFISNPNEERQLRNDAYQEKIARAILDGIKQYLVNNPPHAAPTMALQQR
ncbi:MAG: N-acetylmuramoyl-L-alanine amidase [Betaproteobacteria bacterium]|nr:N-acetylmuramoyl-L-alanine amidase [Betaproteobacteria bacterium]